MQFWLARLSFSLLILAGVCFWQGYKLDRRSDPNQRTNVVLLWAGGGLLLGLGLAGVKARHRQEK
jgi:hypothetical protein